MRQGILVNVEEYFHIEEPHGDAHWESHWAAFNAAHPISIFIPDSPPRAYRMPDGVALCPCCYMPMANGDRTCGPNCVDLTV